MTSPFTSNQRTLILVWTGVSVLAAIYYLFKAFHPRWRGNLFRFTPVALAAFLLICAADGWAVTHAMSFVEQHILWLPTGAMIGCGLILIATRYDEWMRKQTEPAPPKAKREIGSGWSDNTVISAAKVYAVTLAVASVGNLLNLYLSLFGPNWQWTWLFSIACFLMGIGVLILSKQPLGVRFLKVCPSGLSGQNPKLSHLKSLVQRSIVITALCWTVGLIVLAASARLDGVAGNNQPAFATREHYVLTNHGKTLEVGRVRFLGVAVGWLAAWHFGTLFAGLSALRALLYVEGPDSVLEVDARGRRASNREIG